MTNHKRNINFTDEIEAKRRRKNDFVEITQKEYDKSAYLDEILSDKYQPQFLNYQLIGDLVAIMILNSKHLLDKTKSSRPVLYQNFCHSTWSVNDVLNELKSKKKCYPIAKTVILAVGYNDYHGNLMSAVMLAHGIEKIIQKLQRRGCKDLILANIPPCAAYAHSVDHWTYLQIINEEIFRLSRKYDFICFCNIFKLFCVPKNYFNKSKDYVTFREVNYKIDFPMFNERSGYRSKPDLISFSELGKTILSKHMAKTIENRLQYLRHGKVDTVICTLEENRDVDNDLVEIVDVVEPTSSLKVEKLEDSKKPTIVVDLVGSDEDDDVKCVHTFGCTCKSCKEEDENLMQDMLSTIECLDDDDDNGDVKNEKSELVKDEKLELAKDKKPELVKDEKPELVKDEKPELVKDEKPELVKDEKPELVKDEKPEIVKDEKTELKSETS